VFVDWGEGLGQKNDVSYPAGCGLPDARCWPGKKEKKKKKRNIPAPDCVEWVDPEADRGHQGCRTERKKKDRERGSRYVNAIITHFL